MRRRVLARRPSPAMVVAVVALVSSLTGGAVAATLITGGDIKNGSITKKDLHKNSVNTKKVKNETLKAVDFAPGQLAQGVQGIQGLKGDKGEPGQDGQDGTNGATSVTTRVVTATQPVGGSTLTSPCNAGEKAVGGGWAITNPDDPEITIHESHPAPPDNGSAPTGWTVRFIISGIPHEVSTLAICASP
jgi:hypothetical protein